jgi:Protein of unknown function (DUF2959)
LVDGARCIRLGVGIVAFVGVLSRHTTREVAESRGLVYRHRTGEGVTGDAGGGGEVIVKWIWFVLVLLLQPGCESVEYGIKEQFGIEKRDIVVARVNDAMAAQQDAKAQFQSALEEFSAVTGYSGGDLENLYDDLAAAFEDSEAKADTVSHRIDDVERVSEALFSEWRTELGEYTNAALRRSSEQKLTATEAKYKELMASMRRAESRMAPVLDAFRDQVLYLKHNLNAQAIAALKSELAGIETDVARLIKEMEASIARSPAFVNDLEGV